MISFIGKFTRNNKIVAWRISDDGVEYNIAERAPYHEFFFQPMIDSGYKFHDYYGTITTPDGYALTDIVESNEYLSDTELIDLIDTIEVGMLEEKDVVKFFDRDVNVQYIDVLEPTNPVIKTREDFVSYIDTLIAAKERNVHKFSNKPVNAYTAKDALFTLEEVVANKNDARNKFIKMFANHTMLSMEDLNLLLETYNVKDKTSETEIMLGILKGYFAYGVPGIKANITNIRFDTAPTEPFSDLKQTMNNNALLKYGIRRNIDYKFYSEDVSGRDFGSMAGDDNFDSNAYIGGSNITSISPEPISDDYTIVAYGLKKAPPRVYIDMLSEDGIRATFIADCNEAHIYRGNEELLSTLRMFNYKTIDNVNIPFSRIASNGIDYIADSVLIRAYINDRVRQSTVVPKFDSSYKLMTGIGVSPYYAPMYINRLIGAGADQYIDIADVGTFTKLHYYCSDTFRDGFSSSILEKYGTGEEDFAEKPLSEQLEFINEEISNLQNDGKYLVKPEIPEGTLKLASQEYNEWFDEYHANEIGNVNFVMSLIRGEQNIGKLAMGMKLDSNFNNFKSFNVIYGAYNAAKEKDKDLKCNQFLSSIIDEYIDNDLLFKERKATALGCLKDIILYRSDMATSAHSLVYITKVFRENSNTELSMSNRHYGFEAIIYDKGPSSRGNQIFNSIYEQIIDDLSRKGFSDCISIAADATSLIIMNILVNEERAKSVDGICYLPYKTTLPNGVKYSVDVKLGESYYTAIKNGSMFTRKYSSNYDFCENQFSKANMKCDYYCVNASVNPWSVTPREGFKIMEYNIFVNYFKMEELQQAFPSSIIEKIENSGAKVIKCLREAFTSNEMFPTMPSIFTKAEELKKAQEGFFLERRETEDIEAYINRTTFDIKEAKSKGLAVKNTLLKSDVQYEMFKPYVYCDGVEDSQTYYDEYSGPVTNRYVSNMSPRVLTNKWLDELHPEALLLTSNNTSINIERISFKDIPYEIKEWNNKLLVSDFDESSNVYISRGRINYMGGKFKVISDLKESDLEELCNLRVAIQINSNNYIIKTLNGLIKVGV